jgi:hypothetical protein
MRIRPRAFQIDPDHAMSTVSLGISLYQTYENQRTLKLLKRIHRNGFKLKSTVHKRSNVLVTPPPFDTVGGRNKHTD